MNQDSKTPPEIESHAKLLLAKMRECADLFDRAWNTTPDPEAKALVGFYLAKISKYNLQQMKAFKADVNAVIAKKEAKQNEDN